jgi:hypothetical protein
LTAPSIPSAGGARATGSEDSVDVRVASFCSEQSRRKSALCLGLGLRVGQRTRAQHGPTVLRRLPRGDGASRSVSRGGTLLAAGEGRRGCPCNWCRRAAALPGPGRIRGGFGRWAWRPAGGEARQRRRSVALPVWAGAYLEARLSGRLDEAREYRSVRFQERMELIEAVKKQDVVKVKVRRPLEAVTSTESGPSRGVCLGLGQWTLDAVVARPIRPCCAESSSYVRHQSGNCDAACRRSSVPVTTSPSVTRTLPCRLAESRNFSPPPSPAIAVPATF